MTSKPETVKGTATTEATPEGEYRGWAGAGAGAGAEAEPTAEPTAEPQPEWDIAVETWGVAWEFHQYGLGALFGAISLLAFVALVKLFKMDRGARQKKVSFVVLSQIFIFGSSRCLFLCIDAYHSKKHVSAKVTSLLWGIGQPCLITAFMLIFFVLRNALVMKNRFQTWYTTRNITLVTLPYYIFVFTSELIVAFIPAYSGLILACQVINILLYISLTFFYSYISFLIWKKLHTVREGSSKTLDRGTQTFSIFKRCVTASVGGFSIAVMHLYAAVSISGASSHAQFISPWPWYIFMTLMRCLELGMSLLLYTTTTNNSAGQKACRKIDEAPMTTMQSKTVNNSEIDDDK